MEGDDDGFRRGEEEENQSWKKYYFVMGEISCLCSSLR